tara:strand:- start:235 stop:570 length:336 start_codon:yes stop_codon:yes gene_type:complete
MLSQQINELLDEALATQTGNIYAADVLMRSDRTQNLTDILDKLRAVCDITIVNLPEPSKQLSKYVDLSKLNIKFLLTSPSVKEEMKRITAAAQALAGVFSFRIKHVQIIDN